MPHSDKSPSPPSTFADLPHFPDNVHTAPLLRISLQKLLGHDLEEEQRCWNACCELGFFYLDLTTSNTGEALLEEADELFEVMKGFFELNVEEKQKYDFADQGSYFGYKGYGKGIVDKEGNRDKNEFYNISKDDILNLSPPLPSPSTLTPHRALYASYIRSSHAICTLILSLITSRLRFNHIFQGSGGLSSLHKLDTTSGDQIRFVRAPPQKMDARGVALGEHTDFGSVTILFNRLGGLQVRLPPGISAIPPLQSSTPSSNIEQNLCEEGWAYVRPLPGHCIVNLGDALVKFSNGKLRSNIHRVVAPPGEQASVTRYSLVYFCRPEDEVRLKSLVIKDNEENVMDDGVEGEEEEAPTAKEWILRRALGRRKVSGWEGSNGTEKGV